MKAIVCVKQVPDTSGKVAVNPDGTLNRASMATIINPDDKNAVEAALKLKDATGCKVVVITMGPRASHQVGSNTNKPGIRMIGGGSCFTSEFCVIAEKIIRP